MWQQGGTWAHPLVVLRARANGLGRSRLAFVASKKVGNAVTRNRAKRRLREVARQLFPRILPGYDLVLIARGAIVGATLPAVAAAVADLLQRAKLLK